MRDEPIRLSTIGQILRRRRRLLVALTAFGAVVGALAWLLLPAAFESGSKVLLHDPQHDADVLNGAQIAMSLVVVDRAAAGLGWDVDRAGLRDAVSAAVIDGSVIEIKARAGSPSRARQLTERVTEEYIRFSAEIVTRTASAAAEVLTVRREDLKRQLEDMDRRISALQGSSSGLNAQTPDGAQTRAELDELRSTRADMTKELDGVNGRIAGAEADASAGRERIRVIEPALEPSAPITQTLVQLVAGGAVLAAVLGAVVLVAVRLADRRLRRRSDIAAALGAPVLGTVYAPAEAAPESRDQALEDLRYRRVRDRLLRDRLRGAPDEQVRLLVVVADDDAFATRAVARLAAVGGGRPVSVVTGDPAHPPATPETVLNVVPVTAARPTLPSCRDMSGVLVVVTAGTRTAWELLAVAEACRDAGRPITGVLVVVPTAEDEEEVVEVQVQLPAAGPERLSPERPTREQPTPEQLSAAAGQRNGQVGGGRP